jgi:hypothetical protein
MSLFVIARRSIVYQQPSLSEATVVYVPSRDQIQVIRDAAGTGKVSASASAAAKAGSAKAWRGPQLSRVQSGQRYIYGYLPREIFELRQTTRVWLPEDLVPPDADAFFFVFSPKVIIHGSRDRSDEGKLLWRSAQLSMNESESLHAIRQAIGEYTLANPQAVLCIAVSNQLDLYNKLKDQLEVYGLSPVPFSKLKPQQNIKPLYSHYNLTILYILLVAMAATGLVASIFYLYSTYMNIDRTSDEIERIRQEIASKKINEHTGYINQPEKIMELMGKPIDISMSSIIDGSMRATNALGELSSFKFSVDDIVNENELRTQAVLNKPKEDMLVGQEELTKNVLKNRPWIRSIERSGATGPTMELQINIQIKNAPKADGAPVLEPPPVESMPNESQ